MESLAYVYTINILVERRSEIPSGCLCPTVSMSAISKIRAGGGRISLSCHGSAAVFSELSSTYPLKLLSPRIAEDGVAVVYILTYGGGLVSGDQVNLSVDIGEKAKLVLLSQVSSMHHGLSLASLLTNRVPPKSSKPDQAIDWHLYNQTPITSHQRLKS